MGGGTYTIKYILFCYEIDIFDNFCRNAKNGFFRIRNSSSGYTKTYCEMTSLTGCTGGGWTLVMKTDGTKVCNIERKNNIKTGL